MDTKVPTVTRRSFVNEPGEALLLTSDPVAYIQRFDDFIDASGLPAERVLSIPLISTPVPVPTRDAAGRPARWAGAKPSFMWHPLMWLPPHLAFRYRFSTVNQEAGGTNADFEIESDAEWVVRVATAMIASGLYDPDSGTWLDVLAHHGVDIEDPIDFARVEQWLAGAPDSVLDSIDLTPMTELGVTPQEMAQTASDLASSLVPAQWAITASSIAELLLEQSAMAVTPGQLRKVLTVLAQVSAQALHDVPADPETGDDFVEQIGVVADGAELEDANLELLRDTLLDLLSEIAQDYAPSLDVLTGALPD